MCGAGIKLEGLQKVDNHSATELYPKTSESSLQKQKHA